MGFFARVKNLFSRKRVVGLALGSGGAKGMAHLGALKAFEEEGIRFQVVAGSSIGSIVGALYAKGFTSDDMIQVIEGLNRKEFSKNLRPFADLGFAEEFLSRYLDGDISDLGLPFAAWVTDGETNEGEMLSEGKTARVLTASSAIPPFFRGVDIGGKRYYDGAFSNAVPAEACRALGADVVIGIDLSAYVRAEEDKSRVSRMFGAAIAKISPVKYNADCKSRGYESADFMLQPNLLDYRATDVSRAGMGRMFDIGYETAKEHMAEIKEAIKRCPKKRGRSSRTKS